jgi:hypothetical protein
MSEYTTGWNTNILHRIAGAASHPIRYSVRATDKGCVKPCGIWRVASFQVSSSQKKCTGPATSGLLLCGRVVGKRRSKVAGGCTIKDA